MTSAGNDPASGWEGLRSLARLARRDPARHGRRFSRQQHRVGQLELLEPRAMLNAAPVAVQDVYAAPASTAIDRPAPGWLDNDTDADGDTLQIAAVTPPQHGVVSWQTSGQWSYQANDGFVGVDRFQYQATDGSALSEPVQVEVRVGRYGERVLADRPLAYWRFDEASSRMPAEDVSGNGLHGSYQRVDVGQPGAILAEPGTAARFAAENTHVYLAGPSALLNLRNNLTLEAWVKPTSRSGLGRIFVNSQFDSERGIGFGLHDNRLVFTAFGIKDYLSKPVFDTPNQWYHVAVVVDTGNDASFYVNGQLVDQVAGTVTPRTGSHAALLGSKSGSDDQLRGDLDEVAIYSQALSAQQLADHFEMGRVNAGRSPQIVVDEYVVQQDGVLRIDAARVTTPRHSFAETFSGEVLSENLSDPTGSFYVDEGRLRTAEKRQYVRTVMRDYISGDFRFEVDVDLSTTEESIEFIGIGSGEREPSYDEPADALYVRFHSVAFAGDVGLSAAGPFGGTVIGKVNERGVHRVRMTKTGNQLTIDVDGQFDGMFQADISATVDDVATLAPFLNGSNSHLILGGSTLSTFDNLRIESSFDPLVTVGVLANDRDADSPHSLTAQLVDAPRHGQLQLAADGTFTYTPASGYYGTDTFTYRADDGENLSNLATVRINVYSPVPLTRNDRYSVAEDMLLSIARRPEGLLGNDRDPNEVPLSVSLVTGPTHGALVLQSDGTFTYRPDPNYFGSDAFTYQAGNGTFTSQPASVLIEILPTNDLPTATNDPYVLDSSGSIDISAAEGVLANDRDVEADVLTVTVRQSPAFGKLTLRPDGSFQYAAGASFLLTDRFTYVVHDGSGTSAPATVVLKRDAPTIQVQSTTLLPNTSDQQVQLFIAGGQMVSGLDLFVMLGDGGPELVDLGLPPGQAGPHITGVDLKTGTIFQGIPDQPVDLGSLPQLANWTISKTGGGGVVAEGLLATLTIDTTGFFGGQWDVRLSGLLPIHPLGPFNTTLAAGPAFIVDGQIRIIPAEIKARHVFYNDSRWDQNNARADTADDDAIAVDKHALLPGQKATFANYTSYSKGLNGVIVDIAGLPDVNSLTPADFGFRVGRSNDFASWRPAPVPQLSIRRGAGIDGSDRLTFVWPNNAIEQQWLEVKVPAGARTYLAQDDVFYFGNAIGETGSTVGNTFVTSVDVIGARDHQRGPFNLAPIDDVYDFNRDRLVSSIDVIIARNRQSGALNSLPLITVPVGARAAAAAIVPVAADAVWQEQRPAGLPSIGAGRLPGDVNSDGLFDTSDLVAVFQGGKYNVSQQTKDATWEDGDWDGDGDFDSDDIIAAFQTTPFRVAP